ncbi:MAG: antirestriction protein ArdA [Nitrososphaerota archaeon]|jgi:antirestriction protein|nr:antirestriction protein ArdA [Nitrososphaerota archaeon]
MCKQNNFSQKINPQQTNPQLRVYVANLHKYNNGELLGAWLNLPAAHNEIKAFLKTKVGLNRQYEEYGVHDYDSDFSLSEYENLYTLNMLAVVLEQMSETEKGLAVAYCDYNGHKDALSAINVCMQVSELSYVQIDANTWGSKEEKLGYKLLDEINTDIKAALEQCKLGNNLSAYDYFNFEAFGRDASVNDGYFASDEYFIFYDSDLDIKLYTFDEIKEQLNDPRLDEDTA